MEQLYWLHNVLVELQSIINYCNYFNKDIVRLRKAFINSFYYLQGVRIVYNVLPCTGLVSIKLNHFSSS